MATWRWEVEKESSCRYAGRIKGNIVAQGSLLEGGLQQNPSNITKKEVLAGRNAWTGPRKAITIQGVPFANWILEENLTGKFKVSNGHSWDSVFWQGQENEVKQRGNSPEKSSSSWLLFQFINTWCGIPSGGTRLGKKTLQAVGILLCVNYSWRTLRHKCPPNPKGQNSGRKDSNLGAYSGRL